MQVISSVRTKKEAERQNHTKTIQGRQRLLMIEGVNTYLLKGWGQNGGFELW